MFESQFQSAKAKLPVFDGTRKRWAYWKKSMMAYFLSDSELIKLIMTINQKRSIVKSEHKSYEDLPGTHTKPCSLIFQCINQTCHKYLAKVSFGDGASAWLVLLQEFERSTTASKINL